MFRTALNFAAACALLAGAHAQNATPSPSQSGAIGSARLSEVVQTGQVRAELMAYAPDGVGPGKTVWVGLQIQHQPLWHTYWKNAGDSGLPTQLQWTLPAGVTAGDIDWPTPRKIPVGSLANFGYEGSVLLPVPLTIANGFTPSPLQQNLELRLNASWLVCRKECIPQDGSFVLNVPLRGSTAMRGAEFEAARAAVPKTLAADTTLQVAADGLTLSVKGLPTAWHGKALDAFVETSEVLETAASPSGNDTLSDPNQHGAQAQYWRDGIWTAHIPLSAQRSTSPGELAFVLAQGAQSGRVQAQVTGTWPTVAPPAAPTPALQAAPPANAPSTSNMTAAGGGASFVLALAATVLGGLILNLMPCVFPVLAIKVLSLAGHSSHSRSSQRLQGLSYAAGVILSFMALGGLMLALRASGEQLGWGFQLQSPAVIATLAVLFTLIGLNLVGLMEVGLVLPTGLASMQLRHPAGDAFLSGALAVAIASPCTAPFMGASLGYAVSLPAAQALGIFAALGLGLASPFLAASWLPQIGQWLPRPGAWMVTLRTFMAFPMWATVVWLLWVLGHLSGVDGAASLLALLLCLSLLVWSLNQEGRSRLWLASISVAACALLASTVGPNVLKPEAGAPSPSAAGAGASEPGAWQAWAPGRVDAELAAGHAVFVDFTAAWCITCQYNKRTTLANPDVQSDFANKGVTLLRADWTRRDPAISLALEKLGRSGVPVYVLYQGSHAPVVFSEILGVRELRDALATL